MMHVESFSKSLQLEELWAIFVPEIIPKLRSFMERLYARASVSISELKENPSRIINQSEGSPVAILNHNKPSAYLIPAETFEALMEKLEDYELGRIVKEREHEPSLKISLDEL